MSEATLKTKLCLQCLPIKPLIVCSERLKSVEHLHKLFFFPPCLTAQKQTDYRLLCQSARTSVNRRIHRKPTNESLSVPIETAGLCCKLMQRSLFLTGTQASATVISLAEMCEVHLVEVGAPLN